jgi:ketosteroid isomerase-like protein
MSQENVEIVRRLYEHFNRTGTADLDSYALDFEWQPRTDFPDAPRYVGHQGLIELIAQWDSAFDDFQLTVDELIDGGDHVVAFVRITGRIKGSAQKLELLEAQVWTLRDGKATEVRAYLTGDEALKAVGLEE